MTTTIRWTGPPVGIVRVERELALQARSNPSVRFVFFDPWTLTFRALTPEVVALFLSGEATLDTLGMPDPARPGGRRSDRIPKRLRPAAVWVLQFRRKLVQVLEQARLRTKNSACKRLIGWIQEPLITRKYRHVFKKADGSRRAVVPLSWVCGPAVQFERDDCLLCFGSSWAHLNNRSLATLKSNVGPRLVIMCYDIIPLLFPHFYKAHDHAAFRAYFHDILPYADLVLCISRVVQSDLQAYCKAQAVQLNTTAVIRLGTNSDPNRNVSAGQLPSGLMPNQYILFVSTIEPRKGHEMIYRIWLRLLDEGVPQRAAFKLVFVGRPGWLNAEFLRSLREDTRVLDTLFVLSDVEDSQLHALYRFAAFCIYPSMYEGYGLPLIEAFSHGKAVLSSNGGALAEVASGFSPTIDPQREDLWHGALKQWIENPRIRRDHEVAIETRFRTCTWREAAGDVWAAMENAAIVGQ